MPQKSRSTSLSSLSGFQSASSSTPSPPRAAARNPLRLALKGGAVSDASGRLRSVLGHRTTDSSSASSSRRSLSSSEGRGGELRALLTRSTDGPPRLASPAFDADFDELLSADSTIKLSFTPDTLKDLMTEALASAAVATPVADPVVSDLVGAPPQPDESSTIAAAPSSQNGPVEPLSGPPPKRSLDRRSRSTFSTASIPASFVTARRSSGTEHEVGAATSVAGALSGGRGATQSAFTEEEEQDPSGAGTTSPLEDLHNLVSSTPKPGHLASATDTAAVLRRLRAEMASVETRDECLQLVDVALESLAASASATDPEAPAIAHVVEYIL
ncbi:hypothetical protein JCM8202_004193 [Rhodotorula sphaerocarpa]